MENTKWCYDCKSELTVEAFARDRRKKDGLQTYCKRCNSIRGAEWRKNNPDKAKESRKKSKKRLWEKEKATLADSYIRRLLARYSNRPENDFSKEEIESKRKKIILYHSGGMSRCEQIGNDGVIVNNKIKPKIDYCYLCGDKISERQASRFIIADKRSGYCKVCYEKYFRRDRYQERFNQDGRVRCLACGCYLDPGKFYFKGGMANSSCIRCHNKRCASGFKKGVDTLDDRYVKTLLVKHNSLCTNEITKEMIGLKRASLLLRRALHAKGVSTKKNSLPVA